jgi:2-polyprenyl-6-hydroxyphenyl methylase/3-demethylubiquinone-9 3-methyltransferase
MPYATLSRTAATAVHQMGLSNTTVDPDEVDKFSAMAAEWWDPNGKFKPLHKFNPVRLAFLRDEFCKHYNLDDKSLKPFSDLSVLDIGCGGGLLSEPMTRLGAADIDYRHTNAETLLDEGKQFDVVLAMEVIEHVADVNLFLEACAKLLKPGGLMVAATINRTSKAYALAIFGAERVMRWLPPGTHEYGKLVRPLEIRDGLIPHGMTVRAPVGVSYRMLSGDWVLSGDTDVNYMMVCTKENVAG